MGVSALEGKSGIFEGKSAIFPINADMANECRKMNRKTVGPTETRYKTCTMGYLSTLIDDGG